MLLVMTYYAFFIKNLDKLYFDHLCSISFLFCLISFFFLYTSFVIETDSFLFQKWTKSASGYYFWLQISQTLWLEHHRLSLQASSLKNKHSVTHEIISSCGLSKVSDFFLGYYYLRSFAVEHL